MYALTDLCPSVPRLHGTAVTDHRNAQFVTLLDRLAADIDGILARLLNEAPQPGEIVRPPRLAAAMRHAALSGGKRLRPFLVVESAALFGVDRAAAIMTAASLECIHCYSLVHDDLPAMDDDDLRRGQPTVHRAFDEATAILAGDSLLTLAFDILSRPQTHPDAAVRVELVGALARAAGFGGMAGGQMLDLAAEGRFGDTAPGGEDIATLQRMKTGALIRYACLAGAILGRAGREERDAMTRYGEELGAAFQIADDLLDVEGDAATVGKAVGKDAALGKATLVSVLGRAHARERLDRHVAAAQAAVAQFGEKAEILRQASEFVGRRRH